MDPRRPSARTALAAAALAALAALPGTAGAQEPTEPTPPPPLTPCALGEGEVALTRTGIEDTPASPAVGAASSRIWVVDLAGEPEGSVARVGVDLAWDLRVEDFDLSATVGGFAYSSTADQPDAAPAEHVDFGALSHCTRVEVAVTNALAPTGRGLALSGSLDPAPSTAPPALSDTVPLPDELPPTTGVIVAPPAAQSYGYGTPAAAITRGGTLTLIGLDATTHNVLCVAKDARGRPLCSSEFIAVGQTADVRGVSALPPGTYDLVCGLHPIMTATLTVVGGAPAPDRMPPA